MTDGTSGNGQAFILAIIAFVGLFGYAIAIAIVRAAPDPVIFPVIASVATGASAFFFSSHIANGAAGKALDVLVQSGKDRANAVAAATAPQTPDPTKTAPPAG